MQNSKDKKMAARNRVAAVKQPFRIKFGMTGVLPPTSKKGFEGFVSFVTKKESNY